jgi:hypothetical protein
MPHTTTTRAPWLSATLPARLIYIEREYVDGERSYIVSIDNALDSGWRVSLSRSWINGSRTRYVSTLQQARYIARRLALA